MAVGAVCAAAAVVAWPDSAPDSVRTPAFMAAQLGARRSAAPVATRVGGHGRSEVTSEGIQVRLGRASVSLSSADAATGGWTSYARGATRRTGYGQELVTVNPTGAEQLLQVDRRQGLHTWSWRLGTALNARLQKDGTVAFRTAGGRDTGLRIAPVELLDAHGGNVTPKHLDWSLNRRDGAQFLELRLDDSSLPLPYLIDPSVVTSVTFNGTSMTAGAMTTWTVGFVPTTTLVSGSTFTVTFPSAGTTAFTVSASPNVVLGAAFAAGHCATSAVSKPSATAVKVTLMSSGGVCSLPNPTALSLTIDGITNSKAAPSAGIANTNFTVVTSLDATAAHPASNVLITPDAFVKLQVLMPGMTASAGSASGFTGSATARTAGTAFSVTVNAVDQYWNIVWNASPAVTDTVRLSSNDPLFVAPADAQFPPVPPGPVGTVTFASVKLFTAGNLSQTITATDVSDGSKTANTSPGTTVNALAVSKLTITSVPTTATAGTGFTVIVKSTDTYGNPVKPTAATGFTLTASGSGTLSNATGTINPPAFGAAPPLSTVQYTKAESITLTASVTSGPALAASAPSSSIAVGPAAASQLIMSAPASATAGAAVPVTVTAKDPYGNVDTNYAGSVDLTSTDTAALLPPAYAYTGGDAGVHAFTAYLKTAGSATITASDGSLTVTSGAITVSNAAASEFALTGTPASLAAGGTGSVIVSAEDGYGNVDAGFTGTVTFSSDDPLASLPSSYTFTAGDSGVHTFTNAYTLETAGTRTITATSGAVTGQSGGITVNPGAATTLSVSAPGSVNSGVGFVATVTAKDAYANTATGYTGTVTFSSTDGAATLPANYTFAAGDSGSHSFSVTLATSGSKTVTATDTGNGSINGTTAGIAVGAGAASGATSTISASPTSIVANGSSTSTITVQLKDAAGTSLSAGGDTVALSTTGGTLGSVTDNHNGTYTATLTAPSSAGSATVSGTVNSGAIVSVASVTFTASGPGPASGATSTISASPTSIQADGSSTSTITVQLKDASGTSLVAGGDTVALSTTGGSLGSVSDHGNGSYTATLTAPSSAGSGIVSGTVNAAAITSTATVTFTSGAPPPPPPSDPTPLTCVRPLLINSDGTACVPPPPPPPPISFVGSSPADGAAPTAVDSITLTANHMATWVSISVTGPGGTTAIPSGFGVSYTQPFKATQPGLYTVTASMDDGFNPVQQVTTHFTLVPALPDVAVPGKAGSVASSSGDTTVSWTAGTFTEPVRVDVTDESSVGGSFGLGSRVVRVTVTRFADGSSIQSFDQPLELVFDASPSGVPSFSEDGIAWSPLPKLASDTLPEGQADGYFVDTNGSVHVLTRHLTFFGVLMPKSHKGSKSPRAAKATKLAMSVSGSVVRLQGGGRRISVTVRMTKPARVVATLYSPHGERVQSWTRTVGAGASTLNLILPAAKLYKGICTMVLQAESDGQTTQSAIPVSLH